jgi:hypothetical protein
VRRIDSDNLHSSGFGWVVKEHKEGLHALDLNVRFRSAMGESRTLGAAPGGGSKEGCHERGCDLTGSRVLSKVGLLPVSFCGDCRLEPRKPQSDPARQSPGRDFQLSGHPPPMRGRSHGNMVTCPDYQAWAAALYRPGSPPPLWAV